MAVAARWRLFGPGALQLLLAAFGHLAAAVAPQGRGMHRPSLPLGAEEAALAAPQQLMRRHAGLLEVEVSESGSQTRLSTSPDRRRHERHTAAPTQAPTMTPEPANAAQALLSVVAAPVAAPVAALVAGATPAPVATPTAAPVAGATPAPATTVAATTVGATAAPANVTNTTTTSTTPINTTTLAPMAANNGTGSTPTLGSLPSTPVTIDPNNSVPATADDSADSSVIPNTVDVINSSATPAPSPLPPSSSNTVSSLGYTYSNGVLGSCEADYDAKGDLSADACAAACYNTYGCVRFSRDSGGALGCRVSEAGTNAGTGADSDADNGDGQCGLTRQCQGCLVYDLVFYHEEDQEYFCEYFYEAKPNANTVAECAHECKNEAGCEKFSTGVGCSQGCRISKCSHNQAAGAQCPSDSQCTVAKDATVASGLTSNCTVYKITR